MRKGFIKHFSSLDEYLFFVFLFLVYFFLLSSILFLVTPLFFPHIDIPSLSFWPVGLLSILAMSLAAYFLSKLHTSIEEKEPSAESCVAVLLENKITRFVTELRQPLTDIKQIAYFTPHMDDVEEGRRRIILASEEALDMVKQFELENTGRTIVDQPMS